MGWGGHVCVCRTFCTVKSENTINVKRKFEAELCSYIDAGSQASFRPISPKELICSWLAKCFPNPSSTLGSKMFLVFKVTCFLWNEVILGIHIKRILNSC